MTEWSTMGRRIKCTLDPDVMPMMERVARFSINTCALGELYPSHDHTMPKGGGAHCHPRGDIDDGLPVVCIRAEDLLAKQCTCGIGILAYHEIAHAIAGKYAHHGADWRLVRRLLGHGASIDIAHNQEPWMKPEGETLLETMQRLDEEDEAA